MLCIAYSEDMKRGFFPHQAHDGCSIRWELEGNIKINLNNKIYNILPVLENIEQKQQKGRKSYVKWLINKKLSGQVPFKKNTG